MRYIPTERFLEELASLSVGVRRKFEKQLLFLLGNIRHPSLRAKKYLEKQGVWQARVDDNIRFYFTIEKDTYILHRIKKHSD